MTTFIFVRHGQSEANVNKVFTGQSNIPLSALGEKQAACTGEFISENFKIDAVYASDLRRAYDTARIITSKLGIPEDQIHTDKELREINAGKWEGMYFSDIPEKYPEDYFDWANNADICRCTGGESIQELLSRVLSKISLIAQENSGKTVLVVFHAMPLRVLYSYAEYGFLDSKLASFSFPNASVSIAEYENSRLVFREKALNKHLAEVNGQKD
jgi:broad specificity phosphatase PhoE